MKRRNFNVLASAAVVLAPSRLAAEPAHHSCTAYFPGPQFTPLGAERAGNGDGSIPSWTGGLVGSPDGIIDVPLFQNEEKLYEISANNIDEFTPYLSDGVIAMMTKMGFSICVYPTHRTAAAPQYVYDNTKNNALVAKLNPNGGRLGFTGAYGGVPFPAPDTNDPLMAGAQLIWNHLTSWAGFFLAEFSITAAVCEGQFTISQGNFNKFKYPYYDPTGNAQTFDGYFSKAHLYFRIPDSIDGEEGIVWHTVNVERTPDITWSLLNGQGRIRKDPNEQFDTPNSLSDGITNIDESTGFYGNPSQYDWRHLGKKELFVPYNNNGLRFVSPYDLFLPKFPNPQIVRWEKHRVWVVEGTLHPGEFNVLSRRRLYLDEDTWLVMLAECYDGDDSLEKFTMNYNRAVPALPGTIPFAYTIINVQTENYAGTGAFSTPPFSMPTDLAEIPDSVFTPQQMAANASF